MVTRPATTQASRGSAVKLTAPKKVADAATSTAAGFQLQRQIFRMRNYPVVFLRSVKYVEYQAVAAYATQYSKQGFLWCAQAVTP